MKQTATRTIRFLTVDEFRRTYFSETARPSRTMVERWTVAGTAEGVRLRSIRIDGRLFIKQNDAEIFFASLESADSPPPSLIDSATHAAAVIELRRFGLK